MVLDSIEFKIKLNDKATNGCKLKFTMMMFSKNVFQKKKFKYWKEKPVAGIVLSLKIKVNLPLSRKTIWHCPIMKASLWLTIVSA